MGAPLGSWQSSGTNTLAFGTVPGSADTNRVLIIWVNQEVASPTNLTVTFGDETASLIDSVNVGDATDNHLAAYLITEAQIQAATGTTITAVSAPTSTSIAARAYENVEQVLSTIQATWSENAATGDSDPLTGISASAAAGDVSVGGGGTGNASGGNAAWAGTNPMTHGITDDASSSCITAGDRSSSGSETVNHSVTYTTAPNRVTGAMLVLADNPVDGITSILFNTTGDANGGDMDEDDLDVNSTPGSFAASGNDLYISDASTLAGSVNEVDVSSAILTEGTTAINADLTALSRAIYEDLDTLGPSDSRWIIVDTGSNEYSFQITLERARYIALQATSDYAQDAAVSSQELTTPATKSGTDFDGGRAIDTANPAATATNVTDDGFREDVMNFLVRATAVTGRVIHIRPKARTTYAVTSDITVIDQPVSDVPRRRSYQHMIIR